MAADPLSIIHRNVERGSNYIYLTAPGSWWIGGLLPYKSPSLAAATALRSMNFRRLLEEPEVRNCRIDGPERLTAHRRVVQRKAMIRTVFEEFHRTFDALDHRFLSGKGDTIELGAGVYPVRITRPEVLATDVVPDPHLDRTIDAGEMALPDQSVHAFYLQNVFHHFPHPRRFFRELERTLQQGGGAILIEPACGLLARCLYLSLYASEGYDTNAPHWEATCGPMSGANQALSYLVFDRDFKQFQAEFPTLEVVHRDVLSNWVRYLASGGLNFRPLVPSIAAPFLRGIEQLLGSNLLTRPGITT